MRRVLLGAVLVMVSMGGVLLTATPAHAWFHCGTPEAESDCPSTTTSPPTTTTPPDSVPVIGIVPNPCTYPQDAYLCPTTTITTAPFQSPPSTYTPTTTPRPITSLPSVPTTIGSVTVPPVTSTVPVGLPVPTSLPPSLPFTGSNSTGYGMLGGGLFIGGISIMYLGRRRLHG